MSKITKTICDSCNKEIDYKDWYYSASITNQSNSCSNGEQIMLGDYCQECFYKLLKERLNMKED